MSTTSTSHSPRRRVKLDLDNKPPEEPTPKSSQAMSLIPEWATKAASNRRSWKLLVRCWVATWVCFILILPNKTLTAMGNAAFFAAIASFIAPPAMALQMYFFAMLTLMIGCLLGWAWGSAAMAAALQARDQVLLGRALLSAQQAATNQANPDAYFRKAVFRGDFLDTRSTVVFGVFLGIGAFALALMRIKSPKLTLASIFGTIFLDVICSYGPLFPSGQYLILQTFLVSSSIYIAVGLVTIILIFPETLSHEWLESYASVLDLTKSLVDMQEKVLTDSPEQLNIEIEGNTLSKIDGIQAGSLAAFQAFTAKSPMLNLEFSYGRWSATDIQALELPLRALLTRARGLSSFTAQYSHHLCTRADSLPHSSAVSRATTNSGEASESLDEAQTSKTTKRKKMTLRVQDTHRLMHVRGHVTALEVSQHMHITDMIPIVYTATANLRKSLSKALENMSAAVRDVNSRRYKSVKQEPLDNLRSAREALREALATYKESGRIAIVQPLADAVDSVSGKLLDEHGRPAVSFRPLFICFVLESNLCWTAETTITLMNQLIELMEERKRNRLWAPTGLRKIGNLLRREEGTAPIQGDVNPMPEPSNDDEYSRMYRRDPDARPPKGIIQNLTYAVWSVWHFFRSNEAVFAIKYTIVTIALWLPQVLKSSAEFTYNEKGLWALIMAQFGLNMYMSDQIGQFVARILGTIGGGILGMVIWYIGSGHGTGNPYGIAAAFAVFVIPMLFARLFWTQRMVECIMLSVTSVLVVGYSWIDTHLPSQGNPGYGYQIFWRRVVLVLVGFAASFIMMLLPPQSSRKALRLGTASTVSQISQLYGLLISSWLTVEEEAQEEKVNGKEDHAEENKSTSHPYEKWQPAFRAKLMSVAGALAAQKMQMTTIKWERNIRGGWPAEHYEKLLEIQFKMLSDLIQLAGALSVLSPQWRHRLLHKTSFLNPNLISDVMAIFGIVSMSLETGHPVHEVLPSNLLDRSIYHDDQTRTVGERFKRFDRIDGEEAAESAPLTDEPLTGQKLMSMEYSTFATGVSAAFHLLHALDQIHLITKELCGAIPLEGYSRWREEYELKHLGRSV
ncbi:fusaric acid resistance-like protein [Rhizoctonia solani AG-3 Rhs1AP]|uniref:Fusaric acid resistance-like protein n=1 Tax=Rhizoctonia solani AG-3 Rhs1AP TaxID=1086054 RepID=X8JN50_9AGAM|nr:fusaric acid resistance-like protein [Rhizoctonia solani AG-3 Rhs1AP]